MTDKPNQEQRLKEAIKLHPDIKIINFLGGGNHGEAYSNVSGMENKIEIYQESNSSIGINVKFDNDTVWLSQQQMADLYHSSRTNVVEHIKHIYEEGELPEISTCRKFRQVQQEGNRNVSREIPFYNLDMIISLGYRIKSSIATKFRQWATQRIILRKLNYCLL